MTHQGINPSESVTLSLKRSQQKLSVFAQVDQQGGYTFKNLTPGTYQVVYDDMGELVTEPGVNTVGTFVTEELTLRDAANVSFDIAWDFSPSVGPNRTFRAGEAFGFAALTTESNAEYQILVADSNKNAIWSSHWTPRTAIVWNGKRGTEVASPTTPYGGGGQHHYLIKFRRQGTNYGGSGYYGQTKWIPFNLLQ